MIINDVTQLNPISVLSTSRPETVEDIQRILAQTTGPISIGGGRFSMGGQTASVRSHHIDMRKLNRVILFKPQEKIIRVQAGIRWCDIQRFIDPHDLSIKIMQTYANFTVGGSLSVNCHGRYMGMGPLILSVMEIELVLANGKHVTASPTKDSELFYAAIGGYGGLGIIVEAEFKLTNNIRVERKNTRMPVDSYLAWFKENIRKSQTAVFHNADIYPDHYTRVNAVTWSATKKVATNNQRLMPTNKMFWLEKYFLWAFSETPFGKWRREKLIDPILFSSQKVHWRNFEAGYDVAELEPVSRTSSTYVLQEYFVPLERFNDFIIPMREILQRHRVNMINISIRHAKPDPGSILAWATEEVFAFVMYYKQGVCEGAKQGVAVWTRELIDAVLACGGRYYLPYQAHATPEQFHAAYPKAKEIFELKLKHDPDYRFRNIIWDRYYVKSGNESQNEVNQSTSPKRQHSEFHHVYNDTKRRDRFYWFLQNVFRLQPEDQFHALIIEACNKFESDEDIYRYLQEKLPSIKPMLADLSYALPALKKQQRIISEQTCALLDTPKTYNGYLEIGSTGRYYSQLRKQLKFSGKAYFINDIAPSYAPPDLMDRGRIRHFGQFYPLNHYSPITKDQIPDNSLDLITCYIGLHHIHPDKQLAFASSIARTLRPGGVFILRDHDAASENMRIFVALVHSVFNAGTGESWETNAAEPRYFEGLPYWVNLLNKVGLQDQGQRLYQDHDPSDNVLMAFIKVDKSDES